MNMTGFHMNVMGAMLTVTFEGRHAAIWDATDLNIVQPDSRCLP